MIMSAVEDQRLFYLLNQVQKAKVFLHYPMLCSTITYKTFAKKVVLCMYGVHEISLPTFVSVMMKQQLLVISFEGLILLCQRSLDFKQFIFFTNHRPVS